MHTLQDSFLVSFPPHRVSPFPLICADKLLGPGPMRGAASKFKFIMLWLQLYKNNGSSSTGSKTKQKKDQTNGETGEQQTKRVLLMQFHSDKRTDFSTFRP